MIRLNDCVFVAASGSSGNSISDPYDCDVYLVDTGDGLVVIDTGVGPRSDTVLNAIARLGKAPQDIRRILLTHGHGDHSGNAAYLHETTGAPVYAHPLCAEYVSTGNTKAISLDVAIEAGMYPSDYRFFACPVLSLQDGESFQVGRTMWTAIHTPGHCSGHACYLMEMDGHGYLFMGDSVFAGGRILLQNIWDCSITDYAASAQKLLNYSFSAILPSHFGVAMTNGRMHVEKAASIFGHLSVPPQAIR